MTNSQIQALLTARAKVGAPITDYTLVDRSDGAGPQIVEWNVTTLGALPTPAELDAITPAQIAAAQSAERLSRFNLTSRQKDVLATCALIVRARGIPAWNAMTVPQKVTAAFAEADTWVTVRDFIETNTT